MGDVRAQAPWDNNLRPHCTLSVLCSPLRSYTCDTGPSEWQVLWPLSWGEAACSLEDTLLFTSTPWHTQPALSSELEAVSRNLEILANWKPLGAAVSPCTVSPLLSRLPCTSAVCVLFCACGCLSAVVHAAAHHFLILAPRSSRDLTRGCASQSPQWSRFFST